MAAPDDVRVDWFTPNGLGVWGDGRLFIGAPKVTLSCGSMSISPAAKAATTFLIVDQKQTRYMDCNEVILPFGPLFISDIVNRTHVAQDQEQALLATELVLKAQKKALRLSI